MNWWLVALGCVACGAKPSVVAPAGAMGTAGASGASAPTRPNDPKSVETTRDEQNGAAAPSEPSAGGSAPNAPAMPAPAAIQVGDGYLRTTVVVMELSIATDLGDGPETLHMSVSTRDEVRFKVTAINEGRSATFEVTYGVCRSKVSAPGKGESVDVHATEGKAYEEATLDGHELRVSARAGTPVSNEELKTVRRDVRKYLSLESKLRSIGSATPADLQSFSPMLMPQDEHSHINDGRVRFRGLEKLANGKRAAAYDVHFGFSGSERGFALKSTLDGTMLLATKPWRVLEVKTHGPMTLLLTDDDAPSGGSGTMDIAVTFSR